MTDTSSHQQISPSTRQHLELIYDAYDHLYDIASHRWQANRYYDPDTHTSDLFGHYVRSLDQFRHRDPALITWQEWIEHDRPLVEAIDAVLALILVDDPDAADIRAISKGYALIFRHKTARERCMAVFHLIERVYPRATYRASPVTPKRRRTPKKTHYSPLTTVHSQPYRKPTPTIRWMPYKED